MKTVDLARTLASFQDCWNPRIVGTVNDCEVKLAKLAGEFLWHSHAQEDELFLVVEGRLRMRFRDREEVLGPGQLLIVPRGVEHLPVAEPTCSVLLFEPRGTLNTGDVENERTRRELEHLE
jgi:mannose-6-phosphate isomerase-like protein (cupin superfamily)